MGGHLKHLQHLKTIYLKSVEAVKPKHLLSAGNNYNLEPHSVNGRTCVRIQGRNVDITNKKCNIVGFGKAVLGMAVQLENSLGEYLHSGILSIPKGSRQQFKDMAEMTLHSNSSIQVYEGAENNLPDESALRAAKEIMNFAKSMTQEDVLFVLISGGGSALLPLPKSPLKLKEKMQLIKKLSDCGASIQEMNIVRIALSDIKGGKLALAASQAHAVISFVISDIVGDPIDLIASGPTWFSQSKCEKATEILKKFNLWQDLEDHIKLLLQSDSKVDLQQITNNSMYVVGGNKLATATAVDEALKLNYNPFIASTTIQGDVSFLTTMYCEFLKIIYDFKDGIIKEHELIKSFPFDSLIYENFHRTLLMCEKTRQPLLLIMAGEPTVRVQGKGVGGRNQELALRLSQQFFLQKRLQDVCFLSAGTDGIDGPCLAAGAIGCSQVVSDFLSQNLKNLYDFEEFIRNNDSYNFYKNLKRGDYHIVTGHTGTNVMDLHLLLVL